MRARLRAPAAPATLNNDLRPTFVAQAPSDRVTSKLIGLTIQNGANETIGEIADIVLDESSTIKAWVVGVGGFLGIGTKYVAVDPSALKLARVDDKAMKATIDTNKDQLPRRARICLSRSGQAQFRRHQVDGDEGARRQAGGNQDGSLTPKARRHSVPWNRGDVTRRAAGTVMSRPPFSLPDRKSPKGQSRFPRASRTVLATASFLTSFVT